MGGLLFSGAFFVVAAIVLVRAGRAHWLGRRHVDHHVVAGVEDIDGIVGKVRCVCGRWPDKDGEGPRAQGGWGVELSCVCGRQRSMIFIVENECN